MDLQCIYPTRMDSIYHMNKAAPAASPTYKSEDTPPLASATRKSQHRHYSTTTHHHFATTGWIAVTRNWVQTKILEKSAAWSCNFSPDG